MSSVWPDGSAEEVDQQQQSPRPRQTNVDQSLKASPRPNVAFSTFGEV